MKNVISMVVIAVLVTFLFCACAAPAVPAPAAESTVPPVTMETEVLFFDGFEGIPQEFVSTYDENGILKQSKQTEFHENGEIAALTEITYHTSGNVISYQEHHYHADGSIAATLTKHYDSGGILTKQVAVSYWENGQPKLVETHLFSPNGTVLEQKTSGYFASGDRSEKSVEIFDPESKQRHIRQEIYHACGQMIFFCDGIFHADTYELLDGTIEEYSPDGPLIRTETVLWDSENRTRYSSFQCYTDNSSGQITECFSASGLLLARESQIYERNHVLFEHFIESRTYDREDKLIRQEVQYYLDNGDPGERFETAYQYDAAGKLLREENAQYLPDGKRQNLAVTEYAYDGEYLRREVQTAFDHQDICKSSVTKEYDAFGMLTTFTTLSSSGNSYCYAYTYDEEGRIVTELMTTRYKSAPRVDYQETTYEYHENGFHRTVTVHQWTSYDEAKFPHKSKNDLGTTTVTHYDEDGNKIK